MLTTPFATRINQTAHAVIAAADRLNGITDASVLNVDSCAFNEAETEYLLKKEDLDDVLFEVGINPNTLRRAVEA